MEGRGERRAARERAARTGTPTKSGAHQPPIRPSADPTILIHVQPRARRTAVAGRHGDAVKIRIAAPPLDGAANAELIRFLAERLDLPRAAIEIVGGAAGRHKRVRVTGYDRDRVLARLDVPR
jgi:uncharacterized protein (TIGR00251 family)